jgi:hypothetical protein
MEQSIRRILPANLRLHKVVSTIGHLVRLQERRYSRTFSDKRGTLTRAADRDRKFVTFSGDEAGQVHVGASRIWNLDRFWSIDPVRSRRRLGARASWLAPNELAAYLSTRVQAGTDL